MTSSRETPRADNSNGSLWVLTSGQSTRRGASGCESHPLYTPDGMTTAPLRLTISSRSGTIRVEARPGAELKAEGAALRRDDDGSIIVVPTSPSSKIVVSCPANADLVVGTMSGKVVLRGPLGVVHVVTVSGSVDVDQVAATDVRTVSAGVQIHHCESQCRVVTTSGGIGVDYAGRIDASTKSGRIDVTNTLEANVTSVNGAVHVGISGPGDVRVDAVSSSVTVMVPRGMHPVARLRSVSGRIRNPLTSGGSDGEIDVRTISGSIHLTER
jgi:hypothetical protein